jgi:hypothetical protein
MVKYRSQHPSTSLIPVDTFQGGLQFSLPKLCRRTIIPSIDMVPRIPLTIQEAVLMGTSFTTACMSNLMEMSPPVSCILQLPRLSIALAINEHHYDQTKHIAVSWRIHSEGICVWKNSLWTNGTQEPQRGYAFGLLNILELIQIEHTCFGDNIYGKTMWVYLPNAWLKRRIDSMVQYYGKWNRQTMLSPHFDITATIATIITTLGIKLCIHTSLDSVCLIDSYRQALIDCNHFSTSPRPSYDIPIPSCQASIFHGTNLITCKEKHIMKNILPTQNIIDYYSAKFSWPPHLQQAIDWDAREKGATKLKRWKFVTKLSCDWLATNHHLHKVEGIPNECSLCSSDETLDHMFCCANRTKFHTDYLASLTAKLSELKTSTEISTLIYRNVEIFLTSKSNSFAQHPQTEIGWNMFLRGFISTCFKTQTPKYWSSRMAFFLLQHAHELWKQRCDDNNTTKLARESIHTKNRMRAKVEELYTLASRIPATTQTKLLPVPMEEFILTHNASSILLWYSNTKPAISACIRRLLVNDASRLPPNHPSNIRVPPDGHTIFPLPHSLPQV